MRILPLGLLVLLLCPAAETSHRLAAGEKVVPQAVVKKAIEAMGGEEKLAKSQSVFMKGTCTFYGMGHPIECTGDWFEQLPAQLKASYHMKLNGKDVTRVEAVTKDQGWMAVAGRVRDLTADQLTEIREGMQAGYLTTLLPLCDPECHLSSVGETEVAGRPAIGLKPRARAPGRALVLRQAERISGQDGGTRQRDDGRGSRRRDALRGLPRLRRRPQLQEDDNQARRQALLGVRNSPSSNRSPTFQTARSRNPRVSSPTLDHRPRPATKEIAGRTFRRTHTPEGPRRRHARETKIAPRREVTG